MRALLTLRVNLRQADMAVHVLAAALALSSCKEWPVTPRRTQYTSFAVVHCKAYARPRLSESDNTRKASRGLTSRRAPKLSLAGSSSSGHAAFKQPI